MGNGGQIIQGQVFFKMIVNITADNGALLAGLPGGGNKGNGKFAAAHQLQEDYLQDILTDNIITWKMGLDLL